MNNDLK